MANDSDADGGSLDVAPLAPLLARLHDEAKGDRKKFLLAAPRLLLARARGATAFQNALQGVLKDAFIPVSAQQGRFLYLTARAIAARRIVEFGTSFGISTLYLAAAVRDNGGGLVVGSELQESKHARALGHVRQAGLEPFVDIRLGDALRTLAGIEPGIDMVLLDGWKDLYVPIIELLTPKLRPGAVVLADNIFTFKRTLKPFVDRMRSGHGFISMTTPLGDGLEFSVKVGA
jgi:predicted O-methyltransferase YrrM